MVDAQTKTRKDALGQGRTVLLLLFCHCSIVSVAVASRADALPVLCACIFSFLLLLIIPYNLYQLEIALDRLVDGLTIEPLSVRLRWPLKRLFLLVNALGQQKHQQIQAEQRNVAYRDQLLQQVSKTAAQEERNRLARDLHDSIKQQIFGIAVSAAAIKARWEHNPASARKVVDDIERTAQEAQVEMQALLQQLRPTALEHVGLLESLRVQCQALSYRTGAEVTAELDDLPPDELLPVGAQEMIFRIVQEGFANIARHARAGHVWLSLRRQRQTLLIEIGDNGQGFELATANEAPVPYSGMGLSNVRERVNTLGGDITVWSMPGKGTTLHVCIPLIDPQKQVQEQEHINQEVTAAIRQAQRLMRGGSRIAELAAALILLYTPVPIAQWVVGICIIVALAAWLWAQQYRFRVALDFGQKHAQHIRLLADSNGLRAGIIWLCTLYPIYFAVRPFTVSAQRAALEQIISIFFGSSALPALEQIVAILFGLLIIATLIAYIRSLQNERQYCKTLAYEELRERTQRKTQQVIIDWFAWAGMIGLTALHLLLFPAISQDFPVLFMGIVLFVTWLLITVVKSIRVAQWHHTLSLSTEQAIQSGKGGAR